MRPLWRPFMLAGVKYPTPYAPYPLNVVRDGLYRRRYAVRVVMILACGVWLGPAAYRLWWLPSRPGPGLVVGGTADAGLSRPPSSEDRSAAILAAIAALPAVAVAGPATATAPAGHCWVTWRDYEAIQTHGGLIDGRSPEPLETSLFFDPTEVLSGPWLSSRYHLRQVVDYFDLPATRAALQTVVDLSGQPHCLAHTKVNPGGTLAPAREAVKQLVSRARYHLAGRRDYPAAAGDLEAALQLAAGIEDDGTVICLLVAIACRQLALSEVVHWAREDLLTRAQAKDLLARIERYPFARRQALVIAFEGERRLLLAPLDDMYAPGEHGRHLLATTDSASGHWLLGSLNLLSPLLYDRGQVRRRIDTACALWSHDGVTQAEFDDLDRLAAMVTTDPLTPLSAMFGLYGHRLAHHAARTEASEAGARTALALTMFKADRGRYPQRLEELVPACLPALPLDPFAAGPLRYRLEPDGAFTLYSVDADRRDDGGQSTLPYPDCPDYVLTRPRSEPHSEWVFVPIEATTRPAGRPAEE